MARESEKIPSSRARRTATVATLAASEAVKTFGTRAKLIEEITTLQKRDKDQDFKKRYETHPVPRLLDLYKSLQKQAKAAAKAKG